MQTPSETAVAAVECYLEGNHEGFIRYYEDLVLSGISPRAIDRLMEKAGLPPSDQLKKAEPPADFLHHGGFGGSGFRLPEIISTA